MATLKKRTTAPKKGQKWYSTNCPFAGSAYDMFKKHPDKQGNCVHYCYSRMSEVLGKESKLPTSNAGTWMKKVKNYKTGKTPKIGAVIEYKTHVAFVEDMAKDGSWLDLSMSGWNTYLFKTRRVYKKDNYCYGSHKLLGFIYNPNDYSNENTEKDNVLPTTYKVVSGDSISKICKKFYGEYNTKLGNKIVNANKSKYPKISLNYICVGWVLTIPV